MSSSTAAERDQHKATVLNTLANGRAVNRADGRGTYRIGWHRVHIRFCSRDAERPDLFKFNVNAETVAANFEVWVCGSPSSWYVIPVAIVRGMYDHPRAYPDHQASTHRVVVSVNRSTDFAQYLQGGGGVSIHAYRNGPLP
jgi:hypothetical protein